MQLSKNQVNAILQNAPVGVDKTKILDGLVQRGYTLEGVDMNTATQNLQKQAIPTTTPPAATPAVETPKPTLAPIDPFSTIKETGSIVKDSGKQIAEGFKQTQAGTTNPSLVGGAKDIVAGTLKEAGGAIRGIFSPVEAVMKDVAHLPGAKEALDAIKNHVINPTSEAISNIPAVQKFVTANPNAESNISNAIAIATSLIGGNKLPEIKTAATNAGDSVARGASAVADVAKTGAKAVAGTAEKISNIGGTILDAGKKIPERIQAPSISSDAVRTSLNPVEALKGTGQDIEVSVGKKVKPLSKVTPNELAKIKAVTVKNYDDFTTQAQKFAKDRSVQGGSPVEIVGKRTDQALEIADKKRMAVGAKMGEIESKYANEPLPVSDKTFETFANITKLADETKFGLKSSQPEVVKKFVQDFDQLEKGGSTIADRNDFVRTWTRHIEDQKDGFGKFKENAYENSQIQKAVNQVKNETVDAVSEKDTVYKSLRKQYSSLKNLEQIGNSLLGKDGALGERVKGAATVKRAIQSNSDAGARQFLKALRDVTGYDAIKEGDIALTAMENVGDYQGLSLLNVLSEGKKGIAKKVLSGIQDTVVGNNTKRVKAFIQK